jgi:hypothetical protein
LHHLCDIDARLRAAGVEFDAHGAVPEVRGNLRYRLAQYKQIALSYLGRGPRPEGNRVHRIRDLTR